MIEQTIENLTKAVTALTAQLEIQNQILLVNQKNVKVQTVEIGKNFIAPFGEDDLDDRGLPVEPVVDAPAKPKRSRKKKEETTAEIPVAAAVPLPSSEDDAPIMGDEGVEEVAAAPATPLPAPAAAGEPTLEDVRVAFTNYSKKHQEYKSNLALLEVFGAQRLSDLKPHQYLPLIELSKAGKIEKLDQATINKFKC